MQSIFFHESFAECSCCECSIGVLDVAAKGGVFTRTGYAALDGSSARYRTVASRGWGPLDTPDDGPIYNDLQCSLARAFYHASHPIAYYGFLLSQLWGGPGSPIPWGTQELVDVYGATPYSETTDCEDGHLEFYPDDLDPDRILSIAGDGENNPLGPRGVTHLVNLLTDAVAFAELMEYVASLTFPGSYECGFVGEGLTVTCNDLRVRHLESIPLTPSFLVYEAAQYRRRFPIPPSSSVRFEWDIYFYPYLGPDPEDYDTPVLYDTISWQWDGTTPGGYDAADPDTWPSTPWFEMPEYDATLGHGAFRIAPADWRVICDTDISPTAGGAITASNV
jgi:hypothetical protein